MQPISRNHNITLALDLDAVASMLSPMHPYFETVLRSMPRAVAHVIVESDIYDHSAAMMAIHAQTHTAGFVESGRMHVDVGQVTADGRDPDAFAVELRTGEGTTLVRAVFHSTAPDAQAVLFFPGDAEARAEIARRLVQGLEKAKGVAQAHQRALIADAAAVFG